MLEVTSTHESQLSSSDTAPAPQVMAAALNKAAAFGRQIATFVWFLWGEMTGNHRVFPD